MFSLSAELLLNHLRIFDLIQTRQSFSTFFLQFDDPLEQFKLENEIGRKIININELANLVEKFLHHNQLVKESIILEFDG